jgi:hypothetical protein
MMTTSRTTGAERKRGDAFLDEVAVSAITTLNG